MLIVLAIATELSTHFEVQNEAQIGYVLKVTVEQSPEAKEMYEQRYKDLMNES